MDSMKEISGTIFRILVIAFVWMLFTSSAVHAQASQDANGAADSKQDCDFRRGGHGEHGLFGDRLLHRITEELDLSAAQKAKVEEILTEEKGNLEPLMGELRANRTKLFELSKSGQFNEAAVRAIADGQSTILSDLIVAKERIKSRVYAILTPEQKTKADEIMERMENRMGRFAH